MSAPEGARKSGMFIAVCQDPDYSWTPRGGKKKLTAYIVACNLSDSESCSPDVTFAGDPVFLYKHSLAPVVKGNEPGVGDGSGTSGVDGRGNGGLNSGINKGIVWGDGHSTTVKVNNLFVVRHGDECWLNCKPT